MKNLLKEMVKEDKPALGTFVSLGHPDMTEILSRMGFDWLVIDSEHAPMSFETIQCMLQAMNGTDCTPIVRPPWNDMVAIKRILDIGAHGVLIPWINTREDAEYAVRACKYPPEGLRGFGPRRAALLDRAYAATANEELLIIAQIETRQAVDNLDDILSVDGIDAGFIGPMDLSLSYGLTFPDFKDPDYLEAFDKVLSAGDKWKKPVGMYAFSNNVQWAIEKGFKLITIDSADAFLMRGARTALKKAKESKA
jgi:2-keto-3-deoxy-L-rhamnonate aldolase RhmA